MISGPLIEYMLAPDSPARTLAIRVLPHPGGPCRSMPPCDSTPSFANSSGCLRGSSTISRMAAISAPRPPTSSYVAAAPPGAGARAPPAPGPGDTLRVVDGTIVTAPPRGDASATDRPIALPSTSTAMLSPLYSGTSASRLLTNATNSPSSGGAPGAWSRTTVPALDTGIFLTSTMPPVPAPALRRVCPSILTMSALSSSSSAGHTTAHVEPPASPPPSAEAISTVSPGSAPRPSMALGPIRARFFPMSRCMASTTLRRILPPRAVMGGHPPRQRRRRCGAGSPPTDGSGPSLDSGSDAPVTSCRRTSCSC